MLRKKSSWTHYRGAVKLHTFHTSYLESKRGRCIILYYINHTRRQARLYFIIYELRKYYVYT